MPGEGVRSGRVGSFGPRAPVLDLLSHDRPGSFCTSRWPVCRLLPCASVWSGRLVMPCEGIRSGRVVRLCWVRASVRVGSFGRAGCRRPFRSGRSVVPGEGIYSCRVIWSCSTMASVRVGVPGEGVRSGRVGSFGTRAPVSDLLSCDRPGALCTSERPVCLLLPCASVWSGVPCRAG